jgi:hypothetical protein
MKGQNRIPQLPSQLFQRYRSETPFQPPITRENDRHTRTPPNRLVIFAQYRQKIVNKPPRLPSARLLPARCRRQERGCVHVALIGA